MVRRMNVDNHPQSATRLINDSIVLARQGHKLAARRQLRQALSLEPDNQIAWLGLTSVAESAGEAEHALKYVEQVNPDHPQLPRARAWVKQTWGETEVKIKNRFLRQPKRTSFMLNYALNSLLIFGVGWMLFCLTMILNIPQRDLTQVSASMIQTPPLAWMPTHTVVQEIRHLERQFALAQLDGDQPRVIELLTIILQIDPETQWAAKQLAEIYYAQGLTLRDTGQFAQAHDAFSAAVTLYPTLDQARREQLLADLYLQGLSHHQHRQWTKAMAYLEVVYDQQPSYPYLSQTLFQNYYQEGVRLQSQGQLSQALTSYEKALEFQPQDIDMLARVAEVVHHLVPTATPSPTPTPTPYPSRKKIIVDISEQRTYLYHGDLLIYKFVSSTGARGQDTATGNFQILNKIPMAYASTWNLDMPYWLGVYQFGPLENGFHAPPTSRSTGVTMWAGYLGTPVSYGCIILSLTDMQTLYQWAEVGTPVTIRY